MESNGLGATAAPVFDGLIQNAIGEIGENPRIPLIIAKTWVPPSKKEFIVKNAVDIYNIKLTEFPANIAANKAIQEAEILYNALKQKKYL